MSFKDVEIKLEAIKLQEEGLGPVAIGRLLGIPHQTVSDFLNKETFKGWWQEYLGENFSHTLTVEEMPAHTNSLNTNSLNTSDFVLTFEDTTYPAEEYAREDVEFYSIVTSRFQKTGGSHFVIPDTQCKPGASDEHLEWVGKYIVDRKPDVIIHLGDHADMPSLSSYDKGKRSAEGRRVKEDINAAIEGMNKLLKPLYDLQQEEIRLYGKVQYKPRLVLTLGNHEERIMRHVDANPELHGFLSYDDLKYVEMGWEVYDFLKPAVVDGVAYCHYMANPMSGKPYGGQALNILKQVGESFTVGHKQTLDVATRFLPASGRQQWGIVAGACYLHDEDYKGHQGNHHWRGVIVKHGVENGSYNPMFVDLPYLEKRYGGF